MRALICPITSDRLLVSMLMLCLSLVSCSRPSGGDAPQVIAGQWGELNSLDNRLPSKTYLIDIAQGERYKVCYESALSAKWPDFEAELEVALSHWGRYISASINIQVYPVKLPTEAKKLSASAALKLYKEKFCPDADLIVSEHNIGGALGQVLESYSYQTVGTKQKIVSFNKGLFIKSESSQLRWTSLREAFGAEILIDTHAKLLERNLFYARKSDQENLLFSTLLHEAGHVWGLCDQYKLDDGTTNCHPEYSNSILEDDSIMSSSGTILPLFLRNDDVDGIENLAKRRRPSWHPISYQEEAPHPDYIFTESTLKRGNLHINLNVHKGASVAGELTIKGFDPSGEYVTFNSDISLKKAASDLFQAIEFDLGNGFQLTSLTFKEANQDEEQEIRISP